MDDGDWLWREPKAWHEMNRALQDITVLLQYLGEMPDARLLSYFKDTQGRVADGTGRRAVPPCESYADFLDQLFKIGSAFETGRADQLPAPLPAADGKGTIAPIAFTYWSRDFLSAVAAPATAELIRLTHDYMVRRARDWGGCIRSLRGLVRKAPDVSASRPKLLPDPDDLTRKLLARRLARWVRGFERATILAVALAVIVSIYALSGRLILANDQEVEQAWGRLDTEVEQQEDKLFKAATLPLSTNEHFSVMGLCDASESLGHPVQLAENTATGNDSSAATFGAELSKLYASARQAHLCAERDKVLLNLFVVTMHLQSWSSTVTRQLGTLPYLFGVVPATLHEFAEEGRETCYNIAHGLYKRGSSAAECERILWDQINRSRNVAESILGSITQYFLPVLYGFLGAMAATLRLLRRKVDAALLSYTDRARLQQGAILGILCGGVIGLFATSIGKADVAGGLGISALALLAGYNVDGVFRFLDELSERLFRPAPAKQG